MAKSRALVEGVIAELTGNEALLEMLETESATEMLNWGIAIATSIVENIKGLADLSEELELLPRLKALRQTMRSVGNWAVGKYVDPESRVQLRDRLLENFRTMFGKETGLPSAGDMDELLNQVDDPAMTPYQLISRLRAKLESSTHGGNRA